MKDKRRHSIVQDLRAAIAMHDWQRTMILSKSLRNHDRRILYTATLKRNGARK